MKKTNKKGFTIVELVIVIAVIAILAAVLIPNISRLVKKANQSADIQLVRNMNTALQIDGAGTKTYNTMHEALEAVKEAGYDVEKIAKSDADNVILWDSVNQCFALLVDGKGEPVYYPETNKKTTEKYQLWKVVDSTEEAEKSEYSVYWTGEETKLDIKNVGFDAGTKTVNVNYSGDKSNDVVIRTNSFDTVVTVKAFESGTFGNDDYKCDSIRHFGDAKEVNIIKAGQASYHEFGNVGFTQVASGKFVAEAGSKTNTVVATSADAVIDINGGEIEHKYATDASFGESNSKGNVELELIAPSDVEQKKQDAIDAITPDPYAEIVAGGLAVNASYAILKDDLTLYGYDMPLANVNTNCVFVLLKDIEIDFSFNMNSTITVDLNGHTLDLTGDGENNSGLGLVNSNWILKDSKGNGKCIVPSISLMDNNSTMIIESGFYELGIVNELGYAVNPLIKGGTFTNNPEEISNIDGKPNCVAPGYHANNNGDGTWTVVAD